jgi:putative ABC transport system permease protein
VATSGSGVADAASRVTSFTVEGRRREMAIRVALGARPRQLLAMVLVRALGMVAAGIAAGLAGALLLTRFLESLLFGAAAADPATYIGVSLVLAAATMGCCYIPARRGASADPSAALRLE